MQTSWIGWPTVKVVSLSFLVKHTGSERSNGGVRNGSASCCLALMASPARSKRTTLTKQELGLSAVPVGDQEGGEELDRSGRIRDMAWMRVFQAGLTKVQHAAEQRQREEITFHHHVTAGRGRTRAVLSFADVFSSIKLSCFAEFQSGHTSREGQRAQVRLAQLPASFEPRHRDLRGSFDQAP